MYGSSTSLCCVDIKLSLPPPTPHPTPVSLSLPVSLCSGRLMMGLFWRWTGTQSMTSYCQVEKTVNIRWAVFEYTCRRLGVLNCFLPFKPCPPSIGMGQLWPSALLLVVSWLPGHLFVLGSRWRGVFCGLLQHPAALWQDWSKKKNLYSPSVPHVVCHQIIWSYSFATVACRQLAAVETQNCSYWRGGN